MQYSKLEKTGRMTILAGVRRALDVKAGDRIGYTLRSDSVMIRLLSGAAAGGTVPGRVKRRGTRPR